MAVTVRIPTQLRTLTGGAVVVGGVGVADLLGGEGCGHGPGRVDAGVQPLRAVASIPCRAR